ncbi:MAG: hypothetical protein H7A40_06155 [Chlamydiales bacterium]|nr:hypothetical protein [Chlamydiales bacterium]
MPKTTLQCGKLYPEFYGTNLKEPQLTQALEKLLQSDSQLNYSFSLKSLALIEREPKS